MTVVRCWLCAFKGRGLASKHLGFSCGLHKLLASAFILHVCFGPLGLFKFWFRTQSKKSRKSRRRCKNVYVNSPCVLFISKLNLCLGGGHEEKQNERHVRNEERKILAGKLQATERTLVFWVFNSIHCQKWIFAVDGSDRAKMKTKNKKTFHWNHDEGEEDKRTSDGKAAKNNRSRMAR